MYCSMAFPVYFECTVEQMGVCNHVSTKGITKAERKARQEYFEPDTSVPLPLLNTVWNALTKRYIHENITP